MEGLLSETAPIGERGAVRVDDSAPTRMFRIAGLFREFGECALLLKLCLNWVDLWRVGQRPSG
eukprot:15477056-Alexandrium_andersonii.AAC.1